MKAMLILEEMPESCMPNPNNKDSKGCPFHDVVATNMSMCLAILESVEDDWVGWENMEYAALQRAPSCPLKPLPFVISDYHTELLSKLVSDFNEHGMTAAEYVEHLITCEYDMRKKTR